jgi:hypothetical protein
MFRKMLKMESAGSFETLVAICQATHYYVPALSCGISLSPVFETICTETLDVTAMNQQTRKDHFTGRHQEEEHGDVQTQVKIPY